MFTLSKSKHESESDVVTLFSNEKVKSPDSQQHFLLHFIHQFLLLIFSFFYQIKIWNSANNKTNYTVTVATENLECRPPSLLVYGGQDIPDYLTSATTNNRIHFLGNRKLLTLESSVPNSNGQNECVFRHMCDEDMCHYVFISVQNVPDQSSWKICEVLFG